LYHKVVYFFTMIVDYPDYCMARFCENKDITLLAYNRHESSTCLSGTTVYTLVVITQHYLTMYFVGVND